MNFRAFLDFKNILIISVKQGEKRAVIYRWYTLYFIDFCKQFRDRLIGINAFAISFPMRRVCKSFIREVGKKFGAL